ncbi:Bacterial transcription activator%2C effector binding domain [Yersinia nurmii]|uniref:Bacterial transcription activator, effector binding domain n=1 Tax=Yersinia nurmii TaxID=685706 RepID=A0ABM9SL05_9GAMM|nr:GyrI-like domain-containing protein [Yersinia nurmii]CNE93182.1 Bacterial transcription activator%2C effector binding domain [Yersinia nurmii]
MEPRIATLSAPVTVSGLRIRTQNNDEFNEKTAKITGLWSEFFSKNLAEYTPNKLDNSPIYGIYTAYDGGVTGYFDVMAGVAVKEKTTDADSIEIQAGSYLVFEAHGPMPTAIIQAWGDVWAYFEQHPGAKRRFATDYEAYTDAESAQIYIGILP